ncbi:MULTISPECIES: hypothetical protein [Myroides]|uniref:hypothetical protein n=2 Tax=Flavobacteriaceae TaxID=49546 RepID=UPI001303D5A6|nr:hypothetical protein [Myroides phaeus]
MKHFIVVIVMLFFMKPVFPILDFVVNYDAIQELCINKDKPELECNGSCHLKSELAKTAQEDNPFSAKKTFQLQLEVLFFNPYEWDSPVIPTIPFATKVTDSYQIAYTYLPTFDFIKPPHA